jgi:hypothetical protein
MMNIYQIYYEPWQVDKLSKHAIPFYNNDIILTPFFENDVIRSLYNNEKIITDDFFGILSWRIVEKNNINLDIVLNNINNDYNFYTFNNTIGRYNVLQVSSQYHPNFLILFDQIIKNLNYSLNDFSHVDFGIFQNAVIAKGDIYTDYVNNWLFPSMDFILNNPDPAFQILVKSDPLYSYYPNNVRERLLKNFGTPWYQYHTFLVERLWSMYYHVNRDKISLKLL